MRIKGASQRSIRLVFWSLLFVPQRIFFALVITKLDANEAGALFVCVFFFLAFARQ